MAALALGQLGDRSERVISELLYSLADDEPANIRGDAADALCTVLKNNPHLIEKLTNWIEDNTDTGYGIDALSDIVSSEV
jgi:HEAT repeat protein